MKSYFQSLGRPALYRVVFLTVPTQNFLSTRKKQSIRTGPTQNFLSKRKKQSIRTVPTQKCLSVEKSRYWNKQTKKHRIFSSNKNAEVLQGWEQFGYFNFFLSLFFQGGNTSDTLTFFFLCFLGWEQF